MFYTGEIVNKILVIDDEPEIVAFASGYLTAKGYEVRSSTDPREGLELLGTFGPDLCVLDFNMPGLSGRQLLEKFKAFDPSVEVIFLTGETETALAIEMMKAGAIDYLLKPINLHYLNASVERALEHRRLVRANLEYREHLEDLVAQKTAALTEALGRLAETHIGTLEALGMALDFRDQSTSGHSRRVALWTTGIARRLGISAHNMAEIEQGALLHDIGKLKIPDNILLKPGPLDSAEWRVMRQHAQYGRDFLGGIDFLHAAAELVYSHHEKFDGSGYPRGLRAASIPVGARCFAIVDAVDAMVFKRPYNQPVSFDVAAAEIQRCAGTHFDPEIVRIALDFLSEQVKSMPHSGPVSIST
jgi:putative two-component system response regulator